MPTVQKIVDLARWLWYVTTSQYIDADAIEDFNNVYHDIENDIVRFVDEDYYYDIQYTDIVANQVEYIMPQSTSSISGFKKMKDISLKFVNDSHKVDSYVAWTKTVTLLTNYSDLTAGQTVTFVNKEGYLIWTDTVFAVIVPWLQFVLTTWVSLIQWNLLRFKTWVTYQKAKNISTSAFAMDEEFYRNNTPQYTPMYKIADKSIFIYPIGTENVTNWVKIYTIRDQVDLLITDVESAINIPRQYQNIIAHWMLPRIYQRRAMLNEKNAADISFIQKKDEAIKELTNRNISALQWNLPPLNNLS